MAGPKRNESGGRARGGAVGRRTFAGPEATARTAALVEPAIQAMGYELVRVHLTGGGRPALQVMAERTDGSDMTVEDCAEISRAISALLDVEDPIAGTYLLEVSSPGIDRPLTRAKDFDRFKGFEARVETREPIAGRRRFRGRLGGLSAADEVVIEQDGARVAVPLAAIERAKLVLTEELIAAGARHG